MRELSGTAIQATTSSRTPISPRNSACSSSSGGFARISSQS